MLSNVGGVRARLQQLFEDSAAARDIHMAQEATLMGMAGRLRALQVCPFGNHGQAFPSQNPKTAWPTFREAGKQTFLYFILHIIIRTSKIERNESKWPKRMTSFGWLANLHLNGLPLGILPKGNIFGTVAGESHDWIVLYLKCVIFQAPKTRKGLPSAPHHT